MKKKGSHEEDVRPLSIGIKIAKSSYRWIPTDTCVPANRVRRTTNGMLYKCHELDRTTPKCKKISLKRIGYEPLQCETF